MNRRLIEPSIKTSKKGKLGEKIAFESLRQLLVEGKIKDFEKKDMNGIDFLIFNSHKEDAIQIKCGYKKALFHLEKHPDIPVIVIPCEVGMSKRRMRKSISSTKSKIIELIEAKKKGETIRLI